MIKITNGKDIIEVTNGAFRSIYESQGYKPFIDFKKVNNDNSDASDAIATNGDAEDTYRELEMKPIGQWTKDEVKSYAAKFEIDLSGTKSVKEGKERVKQFLSNRGC